MSILKRIGLNGHLLKVYDETGTLKAAPNGGHNCFYFWWNSQLFELLFEFHPKLMAVTYRLVECTTRVTVRAGIAHQFGHESLLPKLRSIEEYTSTFNIPIAESNSELAYITVSGYRLNSNSLWQSQLIMRPAHAGLSKVVHTLIVGGENTGVTLTNFF